MIKQLRIGKRIIFQLLIMLGIGILIFNLTNTFASYVVSPVSAAMNTVIVIDAGHGDFDPGAIAFDKTEEKDLNLQISLKLADIFRAHGYTVVMTRSDDTTLSGTGPSTSPSRKKSDTQNRAYLADSFENAVVISIHQNTFSDRAQHGTQVFYGQKNAQSELLAETIRDAVKKNLQSDNERECKRGYDSIYILRTVENPIVMVECGFITNQGDLENLKNDEYQTKIAFCIFIGYQSYANK
jgi:N-acetylmuramoyl-L-alanine amidase